MSDYYVYERGTTSGGTVYEPMHRDADPNTAQVNGSFLSYEEAQRWIDEGAEVLTATYTDPTTGWVQRVELLDRIDSDRQRVLNTEGMTAIIPRVTLSDAYRTQGGVR